MYKSSIDASLSWDSPAALESWIEEHPGDARGAFVDIVGGPGHGDE